MARKGSRLFTTAENLYWARMFVAVPELALEDTFLEYLVSKGFITEDAQAQWAAAVASRRRYLVLKGKLRGKNLIERLLVIAPELISRNTIDLFKKFKLIEPVQADILNLVLRTGRLGAGGIPVSKQQLWNRIRKTFGSAYGNDVLRLLVDGKLMSLHEAEKIRTAFVIGGVSKETLQNILHAKKWSEILQMIGSGLVDARVINALRRSGVIDNRTADSLLETLKYARAEWTVFQGAKRADGLAARMAYVVSGSLSHESVDVVTALSKMSRKELERLGLGFLHGRITPEAIGLLKFAVQISQRVNRTLMEQMTNRRFRVLPGEPPIVTFARSSKEYERDILKMLASAAEDARKRATLLAGSARGAEYSLRAASLHQAMRQVWEGTGYLTIFHEREVAEAAIASTQMLQKRFYDRFPPMVQEMLEYQARSGVDSYISRKENTLQLSKRVYGNLALWSGTIDKQINIGLLTGQSAQEIGKRVEKLINPAASGGVRYAALRLGRTELANAFHTTTIRNTREMPWVTGYKWNLSSSHDNDDVCNSLANDDHEGLGPGVFKKANVPTSKPHPQCLCYITTEVMDEDRFIKAWNAGRFRQYVNSRVQYPGVQDQALELFAKNVGKFVGKQAGAAAITGGTALAARMLTQPGGPNFSFNPLALKAQAGRKALKAQIAGIQQRFANLRTNGASAADGWATDASDLADSTKLAKASDVADTLTDVEKNLLARQNAFTRLHESYFEYEDEHGPNTAIDHFYKNMLPGETDDTPLKINSTGGPAEELTKYMYGSVAYRTMNARLRYVKNDLNAYDDLFPDGSKFFDELKGTTNQLFDGEDWGYLADEVADTFEGFSNLDVDKTKGLGLQGIFGMRPSDTPDYYDGVGDWLSQQFFDVVRSAPDKVGAARETFKRTFGRVKNHSDLIRFMDETMEPVVDDRLLWRVSGPQWMGIDRLPSLADVGRVFKDESFTSTEGRPDYFEAKGVSSLDTDFREVRYMIMAPKGTRMTRVNTFENELALSRGTMFQVLDVFDVSKESQFKTEVHLAIIGQDDHFSKSVSELVQSDEADMWDQIMGGF